MPFTVSEVELLFNRSHAVPSINNDFRDQIIATTDGSVTILVRHGALNDFTIFHRAGPAASFSSVRVLDPVYNAATMALDSGDNIHVVLSTHNGSLDPKHVKFVVNKAVAIWTWDFATAVTASIFAVLTYPNTWALGMCIDNDDYVIVVWYDDTIPAGNGELNIAWRNPGTGVWTIKVAYTTWSGGSPFREMVAERDCSVNPVTNDIIIIGDSTVNMAQAQLDYQLGNPDATRWTVVYAVDRTHSEGVPCRQLSTSLNGGTTSLSTRELVGTAYTEIVGEPWPTFPPPPLLWYEIIGSGIAVTVCQHLYDVTIGKFIAAFAGSDGIAYAKQREEGSFGWSNAEVFTWSGSPDPFDANVYIIKLYHEPVLDLYHGIISVHVGALTKDVYYFSFTRTPVKTPGMLQTSGLNLDSDMTVESTTVKSP